MFSLSTPLALIGVFMIGVMVTVILLAILYSLKYRYTVRLQNSAVHMALAEGDLRIVRRVRSYERESDGEEFEIPLELMFACIVSFILNSFGIYLLIFQTKKLGTFRYWLLFYQLLCFLTDVHLTFMMQPVPLYPLLAGYTVGYYWRWFGISLHVCMLIAGGVVVFQLEVLVVCFFKKHQAIAALVEGIKCPLIIEYGSYSVWIVSIPAGCSIFNTYYQLSKSDQWAYIELNYPQLLPDFRALSNFDIYPHSPLYLFLMFGVIFAISFSLGAVLVITADTLRMMRKLKTLMSPQHYQKHAEAIRSLLVQAFTSAVAIIPGLVLAISVYLQLEDVQLISELCVSWFTAHSSFNMLLLLFFFRPYRNFVVKIIDLVRHRVKTSPSNVPSTISVLAKRI